MKTETVKTAMDREVNWLNNHGIRDTNKVTFNAIIHVGNDMIKMIAVESIEEERDYLRARSDLIHIAGLVSYADMVKYVMPNRDDLAITIKRTMGKYIFKQRYKLVLSNFAGEDKAANLAGITEEDYAKEPPIKIAGQCLDRFGYMLREIEAPMGVFKEATVKDVISTAFSKSLAFIAVPGDTKYTKLIFVDPTNNRKYEHIVIPTGIKLIDLPQFLQDGDYGVYSSDIGIYVMNIGSFREVYIYPLYTTEKNFVSGGVLTFISAGKITNDVSDVKYGRSGNTYKILVDSAITMNDQGETKTMDKGTSVSYTIQQAVDGRSVDITEDAVSVNAKNTLEAVTDRKQKDKFVLSEYIGVTDNPYKYKASSLAAKGNYVKVIWTYPNSDIIRPGIKCQFISLDKDGKKVTMTGVIHHCNIKYNPADSMAVAEIVLFLIEGKKK